MGYDDSEIAFRSGPGFGSMFFISLIVSAATSAGVFFALREWYPEKPGGATTVAVVEVPAITGMPTGQARDMLDTRGLLLVLESEKEDAKVAAGSIIAQTPLPGSRVRKATDVKAIVSAGMSKLAVPDVARAPVDKATATLTGAKLVVAGQDAEASNDVAAGVVIGTVPPAGTQVGAGSEVRLRVSSGAGTIDVPKLTGMSIKKAKAAIEAAKLAVGSTRSTYDEERSPYIVLRQDPAPGTKVAPGTAINLVVNEGE